MPTVPFVNGVATFDGLSFASAGLFTIRAREQNSYGNGIFYDTSQPITATTKLMKVASS